ncbi:MAG: hypothetical protein KAS19_07525 [Anaerolineales bacterium]|nr:hypothetical protein [Anaerolineales bacterium]
MSNEEGFKLSTKHIILIVVSFLLVITVAYIAITSLAKKPTTGTLPGVATPVPVEEAQALQPTEEPTEQPTAGPEVTPTPRRLELPPTPTPFHVASEDDVRAILDLSNPDHFDYFEDTEAWFDYESDNATYYFEEGQLLGIDHQPDERYVHWSYTNRRSDNVYAEVTITNGDCIGKDSVGLIIRAQEDRAPSGYALEVSCDGAWRFRRHRGTKSAEELEDWTLNAAIETGPGVSNRLGFWGYQGRFVLFVNGYRVGEHYDSNYPYNFGFFAVYVRASLTFDLTATFDDFAYWRIPYIPVP